MWTTKNCDNTRRSLTNHEIADTIGISDGRLYYILHEGLCMKKLLGKLVQDSLTIKKKLIWKQISSHHLNIFNKNETKLVTMDSTRIYHHDPESKQEQLT